MNKRKVGNTYFSPFQFDPLTKFLVLPKSPRGGYRFRKIKRSLKPRKLMLTIRRQCRFPLTQIFLLYNFSVSVLLFNGFRDFLTFKRQNIRIFFSPSLDSLIVVNPFERVSIFSLRFLSAGCRFANTFVNFQNILRYLFFFPLPRLNPDFFFRTIDVNYSLAVMG